MNMQTTIQPSVLSGAILAPASKSSMQRACAAALLRIGETIIRHPGHSNDDKAALGVIRDLGAEVVTMEDGSIRVRSKGVTVGEGEGLVTTVGEGVGQGTTAGSLEVNCGESGLGLRMFAPIIALSGQTIRVRGEGSLLNRPMDFFDEVFPPLGIRVVSNRGRLPLEIQGPLQPKDIEIDGSLSSQFLTGLLFAYSAARAKDVGIRVRGLKSKPYIDLTLFVMKHFGWHVENRDYEEFYFGGSGGGTGEGSGGGSGEGSGDGSGEMVGGGSGEVPGAVLEYTVEGDWSGGAFLLVAGFGYSRVSQLKPAAPSVERATVWVDTVKRGPMVRQVRGLGVLVAEDIVWIPAAFDSQVSKVQVKSGENVQFLIAGRCWRAVAWPMFFLV